MDYSIAIIVPNNLVCTTAKLTLAKLNLEYPVFSASQEEAVSIAEGLIPKGTQIVISTGITYEHLKRSLPIPVIALPFSGLDAAIAIKKALTYSNKIVHIGTAPLSHYLRRGLEFFSIKEDSISFYELDINRTVEEQTLEMISKGYEVVLGGCAAVETAQKHGKHGIEVGVDELVIQSALINAQQIITGMLEKEEQNELDKAILNVASDGIIAVDSEQRIFNANLAAERIFNASLTGLQFEEAMQKNKVIDIDSATAGELEDISSYTPVILNKIPVMVHDTEKCTVISIKKLSDIQELRYRSKSALFREGLFATYHFSDIKGSSKSIKLAKEKAEIYAKYDSTVLISGESGTGKELFAQSIHNDSRRKTQPFVPVNCAALPENLIESELFGYEKGAFTGASKEGKMGFFELADGGTIFLDEISEIPISIQSKLLRVIEEGDVIRVGSNRIIIVNTRIICSSNKDLIKLIQEGKFKEDLYYRLSVLEVKLPPLRERKEDIGDLARTLLSKFNSKHNKYISGFTPAAIQLMENLPLMGNVRELSNIVERTVIFTNKEVIDDALLMETIGTSDIPNLYQKISEAPTTTLPVQGNLKDIQKDVILQTLEQCNGNKAAAARALGIDPSTLWRKLKKYDIKA